MLSASAGSGLTAAATAAIGPEGRRCRPGTVIASCSPSSIMARDPTIAVPSWISHPPAGSPSPSARGSRIR